MSTGQKQLAGCRPGGGGAPSSKTARYGRFPAAVVDSGALARMSGGEAKVLLAIAARVDANYRAYPGLDRLASETGMARSGVCAALRRLEGRGAIRRDSGGGRGNPTTYTLAAPETVHHGTQFMGAKLSAGVDSLPAQNCPPPSPKLSTGVQKNCPRAWTRTTKEQQRNNPPEEGGAVKPLPADPQTAAADPAVVEALTLARVPAARREELARLPGITSDLVTKVAARTRATGGGTGALIVNLRAEVEAQALEQQRRESASAASRATADAEAVARREERETEAARQAEDRAMWDGLSEAERAEHRAVLLAEMPPARRKIIERADGEYPASMRAAILERVRRQSEAAVAGVAR